MTGDAGANQAKDEGTKPRGLAVELSVVYVVSVALVAGLVRLDRAFPLAGNLHALVGLVFIFLPVLVLDRRGRPYERYGLAWGRPGGDVLWALLFMAAAFPPVALLSPWFWGIAGRAWTFAWPAGYPGVALSQLLVVALPEEIFYRGYLMGRLDDVFASRVRLLGAQVGPGLLIQAVLFALGHFLVDFNPARLGVFFPALAFGWLRAKRKTIGAGVVFPAASNVFMEIFRAGYGLG
jgi:membrane protease YdiL (CAAX protease family)